MLAWVITRYIRRQLTWFEGVVITLATFGATVATHVLLRGAGSAASFLQDSVGLAFWGLIFQGWYIVPIGAALPWLARKAFGATATDVH